MVATLLSRAGTGIFNRDQYKTLKIGFWGHPERRPKGPKSRDLVLNVKTTRNAQKQKPEHYCIAVSCQQKKYSQFIDGPSEIIE